VTPRIILGGSQYFIAAYCLYFSGVKVEALRSSRMIVINWSYEQ
jgi:hypothetical protein